MTSRRLTTRTLAPLVVALAALVMGACSDDTVTSSASKESAERQPSDDETTTTEDDTDQSDYCEQAEAMSVTDQELAQDPAAGLEAIESLAAAAPDELQDSFETLTDVVEELSGLDPDDPDSFERYFELALDPEVLAAFDEIEAYTQEECGISLESGLGSGSSDLPDVDDLPSGGQLPGSGDLPDDEQSGGGAVAPAGAEITLEDVKAIKTANAGQSWVDKMSGTAISMGVDVQLSAMDDQLLTADEGLAACVAMQQGLSVKNPAVSVQILSGTTPLAEAPPGGACAPV